MTEREACEQVAKNCLRWGRSLAVVQNRALWLPGSPLGSLIGLPVRAYRWLVSRPGPAVLSNAHVSEIVDALMSAGNLLEARAKSLPAEEPKETVRCQKSCAAKPTSVTPPSSPPSVG